MSTITGQPAVLDEEVWRAWLQKRNLSERATARKAKVAGAIILFLLAIGSAVYRLIVR